LNPRVVYSALSWSALEILEFGERRLEAFIVDERLGGAYHHANGCSIAKVTEERMIVVVADSTNRAGYNAFLAASAQVLIEFDLISFADR